MHWSFISCYIENDSPVLSIQMYCYTTRSHHLQQNLIWIFYLNYCTICTPWSISIVLLLNSKWEYCVRWINEGCIQYTQMVVDRTDDDCTKPGKQYICIYMCALWKESFKNFGVYKKKSTQYQYQTEKSSLILKILLQNI